MIRLIFLQFITIALIYGNALTSQQSFSALFDTETRTHATPHITNLIRNGPGQFTADERGQLEKLGLAVNGSEFLVERPEGLDETHATEHFLLHYTLDDSYNKVENEDYVLNMAAVFEHVWNFFADSLGFDQPPTDNGIGSSDLYDIYIMALPAGYFGITYTSNAPAEDPACASFIKMRNSYDSSVFSDHTELENIQVTAVHEFFHALQFGYNCYERLWFMEATAVWSEDDLYDQVNDLYRYMPAWFANTDKPLDVEDTHMYGSFIFFQYVDEHLGGRETIKKCWERSRANASPTQDVSFISIDEVLVSQYSSFVDAYNRMRIANRILSSSASAGIYRYEEAEDYPVEQPGTKEYIIYNQSDSETITSPTLKLYASHYYELNTSTPVSISLTNDTGPITDLSLTTIIKHENEQQWTVRMENPTNYDPSLGIDYVALVISAVNDEVQNWDYTLSLRDGYLEDFTLFPPYPNPGIGIDKIHLELQVIAPQIVEIEIYNILGHNIWSLTKDFPEPEVVSITWNGKNNNGGQAANGVYLIQATGRSNRFLYKVTYLKKSD